MTISTSASPADRPSLSRAFSARAPNGGQARPAAIAKSRNAPVSIYTSDRLRALGLAAMK